jgi:hypothetical protein
MPLSDAVKAMADDPKAPTAPLAEFLAAYAEDDNWWWRIDGGHHQNLFEAAVDAYDEQRDEVERLRAQVEAVEALIGYGYSVTRSADQGGGVAIVIEETAIEEALANAWDDGWTVGASALTDRYKSGRPNPHRAAFASAGEHDSGCDLHRPHTGNCSTALASEVHDAR